ncbi:MAG: ABC transporter permease [Candidatus Aminicenantes bacterium]|nr:ABC transporter permease [Candidatus Aminicenantes bacterium]
MIKNYLKIACRNLFKHKSYSLINLFGLSVGISCCILILAYVGYELSYDAYHTHADNIYRIVSKRTIAGKTREFANSPAPMGLTLAQDYPDVLDVVRFMPTVKRIFIFEDTTFFQEGVIYADQSVFNVFSFDLLEGNPQTALEAPFTMVVTETTARKYFGNESPVGKIMNWDNKFEYMITGVVKDPPPNSHFNFQVLASFSTLIKYDVRLGGWNASYTTYILLRENTDLKAFEQKMSDFNEKYLASTLETQGIKLETSLQPLKKIHLFSRLESEIGVNSDIKVIYIFSAVSLLILLIACINFMNLATARSERRAKEVGLRKVLGASRQKIAFQFLGESFLFAFLSLIFALILATLFLPHFRVLSGRDISLGFLQMRYFYAGLAGIVLIVGFVAGSYPAFFLSAYKPVVVLRGALQGSSRRSMFRSALVVFQFAISTVLIISTITIFNQQKFMRNKDLGFNKQNLLAVVLHNEDVRIGLESFKEEMLKMREVVSAGVSSMVPGEMYLFNNGTNPEGFSRDQTFQMDNFLVDYSFLDTFEIDVVLGRGFSKEITSDKEEAILINETAARQLEWDNPLGKTIDINWIDETRPEKKTVVGVFQDIHQRSLYSRVAPTYIQYVSNEGPIENRARRLILRLEMDDISGTLAIIERKWKDAYPHIPFYSFFIDDFYDSQHRAEEKLGGIFRSFTIMAVVIACIGLFGLASFMTERRTKEIGIRKVVGSSVGAIVVLLCREFLVLIAVANAIAWPLAFIALKKWLQNFPYAVKLDAGIFVLTAFLILVFSSLTVGYKAVKAARTNPVNSLRYE